MTMVNNLTEIVGSLTDGTSKINLRLRGRSVLGPFADYVKGDAVMVTGHVDVDGKLFWVIKVNYYIFFISIFLFIIHFLKFILWNFFFIWDYILYFYKLLYLLYIIFLYIYVQFFTFSERNNLIELTASSKDKIMKVPDTPKMSKKRCSAASDSVFSKKTQKKSEGAHNFQAVGTSSFIFNFFFQFELAYLCKIFAHLNCLDFLHNLTIFAMFFFWLANFETFFYLENKWFPGSLFLNILLK